MSLEFTADHRKFFSREWGIPCYGAGNFLLMVNSAHSMKPRALRFFNTEAERDEYVAGNPKLSLTKIGPFK
jgi:hypothetical protein